MIINYLARYFYIICFATYVRQNASVGFEKTFVKWLDEHKVMTICIYHIGILTFDQSQSQELRSMIEEGKDKLEWTRKVDQTKAGVTTLLTF